MVWPEVEQVLLNRRYELVLSGDKINKRLEAKNELDPTIWTLKQINFLEISSCPLLENLPEDIGKLKHLSTLTLTSNKLSQIPNQLKTLENLRHLNLSNNQLKILPNDLFVNLNHLETLNLSNNLLEELPKFSDENNKKLAIINLSHNQLQSLPDFPEQLENLSQIDLSLNQFQIFPETILHLNSLKILLVDSNQLNEIPPELSQLHKLKGFFFISIRLKISLFVELRFKSNPLKDNRLKKLMEQDKIKAVLEYLTKQWNEQQKTAPTTMTIKPVAKKQQEKQNEQIQDKIEVLHFDQSDDLKGKQSLFVFFFV
jgi:hypothetical protein